MDLTGEEQEQFRIWIAFENGFDLQQWDRWLDALPAGGLKSELLREREALYGDRKNAALVQLRLKYFYARQQMHLAQAYVARALRLRDGQKRPRGTRRPKTDAWIAVQLSANASISNKALWRRLPSEASGEDVYSDGSQVFELDDQGRLRGRPLSATGFFDRVSKARAEEKNRR